MAEDIKLSDCPVKGQIDRNATFNGKNWQLTYLNELYAMDEEDSLCS